MAIGTILVALFIAVVGKIAADEAKAWLPYLTRQIIARAALRLPKDCRDRYQEEWESDLLGIPGDLVKVIYSLGFFRAAWSINSLSESNGTSRQENVARRGVDVFVAVVVSVISAPVFLLIALLVRLESQGPVLIAVKRVGSNGTPFRMVQFRTMSLDAGPGRDKPRLTRVGRFLRRNQFYQLPAFLNVLLGEISIRELFPPRT